MSYTIAMANTVKQTAFRFTDDDLAILDAIQQHLGIQAKTEALRAVLRAYARAEGIAIKRAKGRK